MVEGCHTSQLLQVLAERDRAGCGWFLANLVELNWNEEYVEHSKFSIAKRAPVAMP